MKLHLRYGKDTFFLDSTADMDLIEERDGVGSVLHGNSPGEVMCLSSSRAPFVNMDQL